LITTGTPLSPAAPDGDDIPGNEASERSGNGEIARQRADNGIDEPEVTLATPEPQNLLEPIRHLSFPPRWQRFCPIVSAQAITGSQKQRCVLSGQGGNAWRAPIAIAPSAKSVCEGATGD
jgi:hypothetical protein